MSVLFASFIFLIEEVKNVYLFYKGGKAIQALRKKHDQFLTLSLDEKKEVRDFYNGPRPPRLHHSTPLSLLSRCEASRIL